MVCRVAVGWTGITRHLDECPCILGWPQICKTPLCDQDELVKKFQDLGAGLVHRAHDGLSLVALHSKVQRNLKLTHSARTLLTHLRSSMRFFAIKESSPEVGSSQNMRDGLVRISQATERRLASPPEMP